ncbi:MAG: hypothetical protein LBF63_01735 [Treponema sp.]|nr:hypothetical protein [Treponema sp.]
MKLIVRLRLKSLFSLLLFGVLAFLCGCASRPRVTDEGVADLDTIQAGLIDAEFSRPLSSAVDRRDISVFFNPRDNTVYLEFRHQGITFRQYWNSANRAAFREALEKYKADYEARNLVDKPSRTQRAYGSLRGMIRWGFAPQVGGFGLALGSQGHPAYDLGYAFKRDSSRGETPYFTVFQAQCKDVLASSEPGQSLYLYIHYTRAQADELVRLFDQDYLLSLIEARPPGDPAADAVADNY